VTESLENAKNSGTRRIGLAGTASERAKSALRELGWTVDENAEALLSSPG
jgi:hypothetical protein